MPERWDLLLRNARVFDAAGRRFFDGMVAVKDGRIAAVREALPGSPGAGPPGEAGSAGPAGPGRPAGPESAAREEVDLAGGLLLPGLVDLHTHVYWGATPLGVNPDKLAPRGGVTTWVDLGSAGAGNVEGLVHHIIRRSRVRVLAFLHLSYIGLVSVGHTAQRFGELFDLRLADAGAVMEAVGRFRPVIRGLKLRLGANCSAGSGLAALELALELGRALELPVAVHASSPPPAVDEVLRRLRPGDLFAHCYGGDSLSRLIEPAPAGSAPGGQTLRAEARRARERGVLFDLGHGAGNFSYEVAERALEAGFLPDFVSSDLHAYNVGGPVYDLPTTVSKLVLLGLPLEEALHRATVAPARYLGLEREVGDIREGLAADLTAARWSAEPEELFDAGGQKRTGRRLRVERTWAGGRELLPFDDGRPEARWKPGLLERFRKETPGEMHEKG